MIPKNNIDEEIDGILEFWFGHGRTAVKIADEKSALWWSKNTRIDREIINRFATISKAAVNGELALWNESSHGLLALIICTDQFPRNMYRDTPRSFDGDAVALDYAKQCVDGGAAQHLKPIEQVFAYLPFEHSEYLTDQRHSVSLYQRLAESVAVNEAPLFNGYLEFARQHCEIIERFGRFPHRNSILRRTSTDEEQAFLKQSRSSF